MSLQYMMLLCKPVRMLKLQRFKEIRFMSQTNENILNSKQLLYYKFGSPNDVLRIETQKIDTTFLQHDQVLVRWLAATINPSDLNQIQGVYAIKPNSFPAVGGNEGCGIVYKTGSGVRSLKEGDMIIPGISGIGTWCQYGVYSSDMLQIVDKDLSLPVAAMLKVNPSTAYRMLVDFVRLSKGDVVAQNGANSAAGQCVIQMCKIFGFMSINVVRDRPEIDTLKEKLYSLGANYVYTEEEFAKNIQDIKNVKLSLNCVGGRSSLLLARVLTKKGCLVTYGGMSQQPVQVLTSQLIFDDIILRGFWMSSWFEKKENAEECSKMYALLSSWYKEGFLKPVEYKKRQLEEFQDAILTPGEKQMFIL